MKQNAPYADPDAFYNTELSLDLSSVQAAVAGPNHVKTMMAAKDLEQEGLKIDKAYLLSCVNSRVDDLADC